jgi:general nucleoside transport system ATP-binding protein
VVDARRAAERAQQLATRMGFSFDWHRPASGLSPAGAQKLEILKLLWRDASTMILDEPTAMLSPADSDLLFASLRQLVDAGATVILVTHRLPEVLQHCEAVTVLREGRLIEEKPVAQTSASELATLIVGGAMPRHEPPPSRAPGDPVLVADGLVVRGHRGDDALKAVSVSVRSGEILGIAGVDGSGQRELFHAIAGIAPIRQGTLDLAGTRANGMKPLARIRLGLRIIPEDRHDEGVVEEWSLEENAALGLQRLPPLSRGSLVDVKARREWAKVVADRFRTSHPGLGAPMAALSGGNQQRFVAARALEMSPRVVLAFQPARGLDLGATVDVYAGIRRRCDEGAGALVVSFDLDELLEHADRIVVMNNGRLFEPAPGKEKDRDEIGRLMVGAT